ncbi:hypothetical protein MBLNU13_g06111t1 [Cladosporium sp. NU13]
MGSVQLPTAPMSRPGVLTRTIVRTPVINFILHARIRHLDFNDVVFVGEDFIHVKEVKHNGHLKHIATKDDFGSRILAAKTFSLEHDPPSNGDEFIKSEPEGSQTGAAKSNLPPQFVVLTLESEEMVFLYLKQHHDGSEEFAHQTCPLPSFEHSIHSVGVHLAVDPASRALAAAAREKQLVIYSAKPTPLIRSELQVDNPDWYPVSTHVVQSVPGRIQHLEFLHPPDNDPDHIILLLILVDQRRTKALLIDWQAADLGNARMHPLQPMDAERAASNLLIPLRNAAFLMITGSELKLHKNILSGSMTSVSLDPHVGETKSPGSSPKRPIWANWCRPLRNKSVKHGQDIVYIAREDGIVILAEITSVDTIHVSHAGDVGCHVGSAFASLGDPSDPDILAVLGDMSTGRVVHMGNWPSPVRIADMTRIDTMEMQDSETLPNWASSIDMVVSKFPQSHSRSPRTRDAVVVTSGREPYGAITELRQGLEARAATYFELEALKGTTGAWVLPNISTGSVLMLLSTPSSTRVIDFSPDLGEVDVLDEHDTTVMALDQRTLVAGMFENSHLVQIGERSICTTATLTANFEDRSRWEAGDGKSIIAATIEPSLNCAMIVRRGDGHSELIAFKHYAPTADQDSNDSVDGLHQLPDSQRLQDEPLCLATTAVYRDRIVGVFATVEGNLELFTLDRGMSSEVALLDSLQIVEDKQSLCDHVVLLQPPSAGSDASHGLLAVCGLRDGRVVSVGIDLEDGALAFGGSRSIRFGHETVRLYQEAGDVKKAYAFSGLDTCVLQWDGTTPQTLSVENLWVSDKQRPQLAQGAITTVSVMPSSDYLSSTELVGAHAGFLVVVSSSEVLLTSLDDSSTVVPRQIQVTGTPSRLIYAGQQRSFVCASMCTGVRHFASDRRNAQPEERRQIWPIIEFIPADKDSVSFSFDLQPGERVYALLEWSFQQNGKTYSSIMVGGSYIRQKSDGQQQQKGRISFLQPRNRNWQVESMNESRSITFDDPVYALALYDELSYVVCTGSQVQLSRFDTDVNKWEQICAPYRLANKGTSITISGALIYISTASEGLITLRLTRSPSRSEDGTFAYTLTPMAQPPRADRPLNHTIVPITADVNLALVTTSEQQLLGLTSPSPNATTRHRTALLFEAQLPRSINRIKQGSIRPFWAPTPPPGVLASNVVGLSTDGSVTGISIIDEALWRRLFWLQRVLEWDEHFSPHAPEFAIYGVDAECSESLKGRARGVPIGFASGSTSEIALFSRDYICQEGDRHIDGDVLARVLQSGGAEKLQAALRTLAERGDQIGEWVEQHLDEQLAEVEGIVSEVRTLVTMWM